VNNEEASQSAEVTDQDAPQKAAALDDRDDEAEEGKPAVERWHAVTADGLVSAHTKNQLKKKLRAVPGSQIGAIIRGKKLSLQTSVSF
jgi:hypothetical protein